MSAVNPAVKFNYLKGGFSIVGDHPDAREASKGVKNAEFRVASKDGLGKKCSYTLLVSDPAGQRSSRRRFAMRWRSASRRRCSASFWSFR